MASDSLEATIRNENQPDSLPVITIEDAKIACFRTVFMPRSSPSTLLDYLMRIDEVRSGRL